MKVKTTKKGKGVYSSLCIGNSPQSYGVSPAIWDHTVLPATWHRWTCPGLTPAMQAATWFTYPGVMEGWVELDGWLYTEMVYLSADSHHPSSNHSIATWPGVEPKPCDRKSNVLTITLPSHYYDYKALTEFNPLPTTVLPTGEYKKLNRTILIYLPGASINCHISQW